MKFQKSRNRNWDNYHLCEMSEAEGRTHWSAVTAENTGELSNDPDGCCSLAGGGDGGKRDGVDGGEGDGGDGGRVIPRHC
ncbi:Hypothetical predicted protein [Octopus vulgaris]|uniref:Uncharacterized protein n=1 Tax=Octopus vulgaris TaxID=6645 RepID=A0AA36BXT0_OCTVU|nr:Hypothetical predicted protein [Octopus vulgaris]